MSELIYIILIIILVYVVYKLYKKNKELRFEKKSYYMENNNIGTISLIIIILLVFLIYLNLNAKIDNINYQIITSKNYSYVLNSNINIQLKNLQYLLNFYIENLERMEFYYGRDKINFTEVPTGYYVNNSYYCVWTKNRTFEYINNTDHHEVCHELISKDPSNHFCKA